MGKPLPLFIRGTGRCMPKQVRTNADYAKYLDTTDEWIVSRTGIRERRIVGPGETTATLGTGAAQAALEDAGIEASDLDLILCATVSADCPFPSAANFIQERLGISGIPSFDIAAACTGFVYAAITAASFLETGQYRNILVLGAETLSHYADPEDRSTCILFGDGAGAVVVSPPTDGSQMMLSHAWGVQPDLSKLIWVPGGGSLVPPSQKMLDERLHYLRMEGREVFKYAVPKMVSLLQEALDDAALTIDDVALVIPHQSNARMIDSARKRLGWPEEKMYVNIDRYGNTSAASVPIALDEARREGRLSAGDVVVLLGIGAGITYATAVVRL